MNECETQQLTCWIIRPNFEAKYQLIVYTFLMQANVKQMSCHPRHN
jgi:hypothetical protein